MPYSILRNWDSEKFRNYSCNCTTYFSTFQVKKEVKRERLKAGLGNPEEDDGAQSSDEDEDKYVEKMDMPGTKVDAAERYTVRNLRIREDTAKYLRNLDPNSAYYDPKTRAMRKNPYESTGRKGTLNNTGCSD